jgi:transcriptional regulator with XRE-family HTH domain
MATRERNDDLARHFGENLRRGRKLARMSQEELACRAALHRTEVSFLERGFRVPSIETLLKVAAAVEVPERRLLDGVDWIPNIGCGKGAFVFHAPLNPSMLRWIGHGNG